MVGKGEVQRLRLCAGLTDEMLGVLLGQRVQVRLTVLGMWLGGGITSAGRGALTKKCWHSGRKRGQLGRELRWRKRRRQGGEVRNGAG